jgi:hypothetical protein
MGSLDQVPVDAGGVTPELLGDSLDRLALLIASQDRLGSGEYRKRVELGPS